MSTGFNVQCEAPYISLGRFTDVVITSYDASKTNSSRSRGSFKLNSYNFGQKLMDRKVE